MTLTWILIALFLAALAVVLYPLFTPRGGRPLPEGLEDNPHAELEARRDLLLRQLKELEYEQAAHNMADADAAELQTNLESELSEVLEQLDKDAASAGAGNDEQAPPPGVKAINVMAGALILLVAGAASGGLYLVKGTPNPPAARQADNAHRGAPDGEEVTPDQIKAMVENLALRLQEEPDNIKGWMMLGRSYQAMGRFGDSIKAYAHVVERQPNNIDAAAAMALVQIQSGEAAQMKLGMELMTAILIQDPNRPEALWYVGIDAFQKGEMAVAIDHWEKLLPLLPPEAAFKKQVETMLAQAREKS